MRKSVKLALATSALAVVGGLFLAGASFAERGFGPGPMMGPMGGFGEMRREMLKTIDANDDGTISQDEINNAVNARFTEFDADKNGSLSLQEFEALWAEITRPMAVRAFQFLDPNGDAGVSKAELDDRFDKVVARFDRNGDGVLSAADHPHGMRHGHGPRRWWQYGPDGGPGNDGPDGGPGGPDGPPAGDQ